MVKRIIYNLFKSFGEMERYKFEKKMKENYGDVGKKYKKYLQIVILDCYHVDIILLSSGNGS